MIPLVQHPPLRIVSALLAIIAGVSMHNMETLLLLLLLGQCWLLICKIPFCIFFTRFRLIIPFIAFSFLFFILYEPGTPVYELSWLTLSSLGLEKASIYSARLVFTVQMLTVLFYKLSWTTFFQSLLQLKLPGIFVELILFTLRFMEVIRVEAVTMLQAMKSRGLRPSNFISIHYYVLLSRLLGSLLIRALQRSERVYAGMMSRGYQGVLMVQAGMPLQRNDWYRATFWLLPVYMLLLFDFYQIGVYDIWNRFYR